MLTAEFTGFKVSVLRLPQDSDVWNLVYSFLEIRREVFIEKMNWKLVDTQGIEFEQYDIAMYATYVIAHDHDDNVIAGARIIRCDQRIGIYSYMIRDAYLGKIDLPASICSDEPTTDPNAWELTRLLSTARDPKVAKAVLDVTNDFIYQQGGEKCLFLGPPGFIRMAKSSGYEPVRLGPICGDSSGRFLAFECAVRDRPERKFIQNEVHNDQAENFSGRRISNEHG